MSQVEKNEENLEKCTCQKCPSYNDCAKDKQEKLYCSEMVGKSSCVYKMNGCICMACPVHNKYKLNAGYYCLKGSANK